MARQSISGLEEVLKKMEQMRLNAQKKHVRKSVRKALIPVRDDAKANAKQIDDPNTREKIYQNIQIQSGKTKNKNEVKYRVGVKGGAKAKGDKKRGRGGDTFYWRFIELGTAKMPAIPFLRSALEKNKQNAITIFAEEMRKGILEDIKS